VHGILLASRNGWHIKNGLASSGYLDATEPFHRRYENKRRWSRRTIGELLALAYVAKAALTKFSCPGGDG
jgi:hypothetical protein